VYCDFNNSKYILKLRLSVYEKLDIYIVSGYFNTASQNYKV